jgi:hypothetical protein
MLLGTQLFQSFRNSLYGIPIAQRPSPNPLTLPYGCFIISGTHIPENLPLTALKKGEAFPESPDVLGGILVP